MSFSLNPYTPPDFDREPLASAPDAKLVPAPLDGVAPEGYHAMSIYPEYFKIDGSWLLAKDSRMDCVPVYEDGRIFVREFRHIRAGDAVVCGRTETGAQGIYVHATGFDPAPDGDGELAGAGRHADNFAFRLGRSRETAFSREYDELYELLRYERDHGYVVWVMGPAFSFNGFSRTAFSKIIEAGYVDAVFAGNALATHDLEGSYFHTALGQDIETQENRPLGHYNHLDTINRVRLHGSIARFIEEEQVCGGIMHALEKKGVPYVLAGSIRDDGPLPSVIGNAYEAQDAMRDHLRKATTGGVHGHHAAHHRHGQHDAVVPRASRRHGAPGVLLLRRHRRVRGEQAHRPRLARLAGHRDERAGLHRERGEGAGAVTSPAFAATHPPSAAPRNAEAAAFGGDAGRSSPSQVALRPTARPASERRPYSPSVPREASVHPSAATHSTATATRAAFGTRRLFAGTMSMARSPPSAPPKCPLTETLGTSSV